MMLNTIQSVVVTLYPFLVASLKLYNVHGKFLQVK